MIRSIFSITVGYSVFFAMMFMAMTFHPSRSFVPSHTDPLFVLSITSIVTGYIVAITSGKNEIVHSLIVSVLLGITDVIRKVERGSTISPALFLGILFMSLLIIFGSYFRLLQKNKRKETE